MINVVASAQEKGNIVVHYYTRGEGTLFTCPNRIVYLPRPLTGDQITAIWEELLIAPPSLIGSLEIITKVLDPTFETLPDFIAVYFEQRSQDQKPGHRDVCVALRGDLSLTLVLASQEERTFSGAAATMWREESAQDVSMLGVGNIAHCALPLIYGVCYSDGFIWAGEGAGIELPVDNAEEFQAPVPATPDLGETLTELPEEWFESQPPLSTAPLLATPLTAAQPVAPSQPVGAARTADPTSAAPPNKTVAPGPSAAPGHTQTMPPAPPNPLQNERATAVLSQPYFGTVQFSHGQEVDLGEPIVVGRKPSIAGSGAQPGAILVTVPSPSKDISRNHLGIHLDQGFVIATDLGSVNGTLLKRGGQPNRRLNPREGTLILNGDILDLGDNAILLFEGLG